MSERRNNTKRSRRVRGLATVIGLLLVGPAAVDVIGQGMVGGGAVLDANLRFGSGGYNSATGSGGLGRSSFRRGGYDPLGAAGGFSGRASGFYGAGGVSGVGGGGRGGGGGGGRLDRYNAFLSERGYDPTRSGRPVITGTRVPLQPAGGAPPRTSSARSWSTEEPAYDADLESGVYESETAQQQANTLSYGVGFAIGERIRQRIAADFPNADVTSIIAGFRDAVNENTGRMSEDEIEELLHELYERVTGLQVKRRLESDPEFREEYDRNAAEGRALQDKLAREAEVVTLENGLQYRVLKEGTGPSPEPDDAVTVRYKLLSPEGVAVTDQIRATIYLGYSTEGAQIALTMMTVGSVWQVAIPSSLGHGANGRMPLHGPGVTMYFEVELVAIN